MEPLNFTAFSFHETTSHSDSGDLDAETLVASAEPLPRNPISCQCPMYTRCSWQKYRLELGHIGMWDSLSLMYLSALYVMPDVFDETASAVGGRSPGAEDIL